MNRKFLAALAPLAMALAALTAVPAQAAIHKAVIDPITGLVATDVAAAAGIAENVNNGYGNSLTDLDLNLDGTPDLLLGRHVTQGAEVYFGNGDGTYRLSQTLPVVDRHSCAWGYLNADAYPDVYCAVGADHGTSSTKTNEVWLNDGTGLLVLEAGAGGAADPTGRGRFPLIGDFSHDGNNDVMVGNDYPAKFPSNDTMFFGDGTGQFALSTGWKPRAYSGGLNASSCDYNLDGALDFYITGTPDHLEINNGVGVMTDQAQTLIGKPNTATGVPSGSRGVLCADLNHDGRPDVASVQNTRLQVFLQNSAGHLVLSYTLALTAGRGIAGADVDLNGNLDLYIVQGWTSSTVHTNAADLLLMGDGTGIGWTPFVGLPQATAGAGASVNVIPNYVDPTTHVATGRPALLVTNGGDGIKTYVGPRQLIDFTG